MQDFSLLLIWAYGKPFGVVGYLRCFALIPFSICLTVKGRPCKYVGTITRFKYPLPTRHGRHVAFNVARTVQKFDHDLFSLSVSVQVQVLKRAALTFAIPTGFTGLLFNNFATVYKIIYSLQ